MRKIMAVGAVGMLLQACTWVDLTPEGNKTRVLSAAEVTNCTKVGTTTVNTKDTVGGIDRSPEYVQEELEALARNSAAADLHGDTVVPLGKPKDGKQQFEVYRCINP